MQWTATHPGVVRSRIHRGLDHAVAYARRISDRLRRIAVIPIRPVHLLWMVLTLLLVLYLAVLILVPTGVGRGGR